MHCQLRQAAQQNPYSHRQFVVSMGVLEWPSIFEPKEATMSDHSPAPQPEEDVVESIVPLMHFVLPIGGAVLIFMLAFIAIFMA